MLAWCALAQQTVLMNAPVLEQSAIVRGLPPYPPASQRQNHQGVAVCEIKVAVDGTVANIRVLQAPDAEISAAVSATLRTWRFRRLTSEGKPVLILTRMVFYFRRVGDAYTVIDAAAEEAKRQAGAT